MHRLGHRVTVNVGGGDGVAMLLLEELCLFTVYRDATCKLEAFVGVLVFPAELNLAFPVEVSGVPTNDVYEYVGLPVIVAGCRLILLKEYLVEDFVCGVVGVFRLVTVGANQDCVEVCRRDACHEVYQPLGHIYSLAQILDCLQTWWLWCATHPQRRYVSIPSNY